LDRSADLRGFVFTWSHAKAPPPVPVELLEYLAQLGDGLEELWLPWPGHVKAEILGMMGMGI